MKLRILYQNSFSCWSGFHNEKAPLTLSFFWKWDISMRIMMKQNRTKTKNKNQLHYFIRSFESTLSVQCTCSIMENVFLNELKKKSKKRFSNFRNYKWNGIFSLKIHFKIFPDFTSIFFLWLFCFGSFYF